MSGSGKSRVPAQKKTTPEQRKLGLWILGVCLAIVVVAAIMAFAVNGIYTDAVDQKSPEEQPVAPPDASP